MGHISREQLMHLTIEAGIELNATVEEVDRARMDGRDVQWTLGGDMSNLERFYELAAASEK
jgi:hypothetical protein